ncbi:MAG: hypothetical protein AB7G13_30015 [Lautropia sp.]
MTGRVEIRQIAYSDATLALHDPGFLLLDSRDNPRPDWWEYWPIRRFLATRPLADDTWYGFVSPRFREKTGLPATDAIAFVADAIRAEPPADVVLFSPQVDLGAFFLNLFEQNELFDPGFAAIAERTFAAIGAPVRLAGLLMDSRQVVVSNYFVARPAFWHAWSDLCERIFRLCEDETAGEREATGEGASERAALRALLTASTSYKGGAQRKIFLIERVASLLLATEPRWRTRAYDPYRLAWSATRLNRFAHEAVLSDALKIAARETGHPEFMHAYARVREILRQPDPRGPD